MERGVIATAGSICINEDSSMSFGSNLTPETIRYYMLYWDHLMIPDNNLISFGIPDEDQLQNTKRYYRPRTQFTGSFRGNEIAKAIIKDQNDLAQLFSKDPKIDWITHQNGDGFILPDKNSQDINALRFGLRNVLPIPNDDININDVLEFKSSRADELESLQSYLDELYFEVLNSPDQTLQGKLAISRLEKSINDLDRVTKERFKFFKKIDVQFSYSLKGKDIVDKVKDGTSLGGLYEVIDIAKDYIQHIQEKAPSFDLSAGYSTALTGLAVGAVCGVVSGISVSVKPTKITNGNENKIHFNYLTQASKSGIITL
ncbi:TPA: DUF6236 family protein [Photobacterium damselae]